ncbi:MAG: hypothetical protein FWF77_04400 [Defluviitaleaceae bacterium]|nr:hypothetical protein [Defluviitaleaceae bacterium]
MDIVLDTTVQIDRVLGSKKRKSRISEAIAKKECFSTMYVLGEYNSTIIKNYVTMYAIIDQADDLNEAEIMINESAFGRSQNRMHKIFIFLRKLYGDNLDNIKDNLKANFDVLIHKFYTGINKDLLSGTKCNRANAYIEYSEGCPVLKESGCRKTDNRCDIASLWKRNYIQIEGLVESSDTPKGKSCTDVGDLIICIETFDGGIHTICTSNSKDFMPITKHLGMALIVPNYSDAV